MLTSEQMFCYASLLESGCSGEECLRACSETESNKGLLTDTWEGIE